MDTGVGGELRKGTNPKLPGPHYDDLSSAGHCLPREAEAVLLRGKRRAGWRVFLGMVGGKLNAAESLGNAFESNIRNKLLSPLMPPPAARSCNVWLQMEKRIGSQAVR